MIRMGSILHGAYGDYYEQLISLKHFKNQNLEIQLILFFATKLRCEELRVFDLSFADEVYLAEDIPFVNVDIFLQFQVKDRELQQEILSKLPETVLRKIDREHVIKPWQHLKKIDFRNGDNAIPLSEFGRERLPMCMENNQIRADIFETSFTVGFLWRYREPGGAISAFGQRTQSELIKTNSDILLSFVEKKQAHILICGMGVVTNDSNRDRTDNKYTALKMEVDDRHCTYLQGLNWGLELEIMSRCDICIVMSSGFSEALWIKREHTLPTRLKPTVLINAQPQYVAKLVYNRMPLFDILNPGALLFQLRQPHDRNRVHAYLKKYGQAIGA